jgi:hypothetical protein
VVGALHPKAMPMISRTPEEIDVWRTAPAAKALTTQKRLPDGSLTIVARGKKEGGDAPGHDMPVSATRDGSDLS